MCINATQTIPTQLKSRPLRARAMSDPLSKERWGTSYEYTSEILYQFQCLCIHMGFDITKIMKVSDFYFSFRMRKPTIWVSDQVWHKPACTVIEDGKRLEIVDLENTGRGIVLFV